jgi:hypothetical protein
MGGRPWRSNDVRGEKAMRNGVRVFLIVTVGVLLALSSMPSNAWAQTTGTGAFAQLSPGNQKIAQALFEAQTKSTDPNAPKPLTLDEIATKKQGHEGWGEVFKDMKAQGLVAQKNLGQVVKSFESQHHESVKLEKAEKAQKAEKAEKIDKIDRPARPERLERVERPERPERPGR